MDTISKWVASCLGRKNVSTTRTRHETKHELTPIIRKTKDRKYHQWIPGIDDTKKRSETECEDIKKYRKRKKKQVMIDKHVKIRDYVVWDS